MKIHVGKAYEGTSGNAFKDGEYELQIVNIKATKGRVNMTFATSKKRLLYKTFFLLDKKGDENENAYIELADFVTTAVQIDEEDVELDIKNALGCYLKLTLRNSSYEKDGVKQASYWLNKPKRCDGFSDGTGSVLEDIRSKNRRVEAEEVEEEEIEAVAEDTTEVEESGESNYDSFFEA